MADFEAIASRMLKFGEKIEAKVEGRYSHESAQGNHEIVKGFMAATNHRVLIVHNSFSFRTQKDSFTYGQVTTVTTFGDKINLILPDQTITLYEVDDDDLERFHKYVTEKKTPPPKTTIAGRDIEVVPPAKK